MAKRKKNGILIGRLILGILIVCAMIFTVVWAIKTKGETSDTASPATVSQTEEKEPVKETPAVTDPHTGLPYPTDSETGLPYVEDPDTGEHIPVDPETGIPQRAYVVSRATVASSGDILIHTPLLATAKQGDGSYDFNWIFPYAKAYYEKYDYMVMNLEVPLGGPEAGPYDGYPRFNAPDSLATALKDAGVDMLLTANNHSSDAGGQAMMRTTNAVRTAGMDTLGTRASAAEPLYTVKEINGIPIGMACYTYGSIDASGKKSLNGNGWMSTEISPMINVFDYGRIDDFYAEAEKLIADMKAAGAAITAIYVHWGNEYQYRQPNNWQKQIGQKLADLGFDLIIGGHPHVVQPVETLTGVNGNETFCVYSMGNAVSNQRKSIMTAEAPQGHTEDGMIFTYTVEKLSDGTYKISDVNILPTWVHMYTENGKRIYEIVPLDISVSDWTQFGMTDPTEAMASYNRTMGTVGEGLNAYRASHGLTEVPARVD